MSQLPALGGAGADEAKEAVKRIRDILNRDGPDFLEEAFDQARAEKSMAAMKPILDFMRQAMPGLDASAKGSYDNLPMVNITFGAGFVTTVVQPSNGAPTAHQTIDADDIEDVVPRPITPAKPEISADPDAQELLDLLDISFTVPAQE